MTGRRAVLGLAAGSVVALSGCTADDGPGAGPDEPSPTLPPDDGDHDLVAEVTGALAAQHALVRSVVGDFPALRGDLQPFRRLHRIHLETLGGHDGPSTPARRAGNRRAARRQVLRAEERLQRHLVGAAVDAGSGSLAKLLASMSAAVAQQLAVLR